MNYTASKRLIRSNNSLTVFSTINDKIGVRFSNCEIKDGGFLISTFGCGNTFEEACEDYIKQIQGKTLVFDAFGERKEVILI